MSTTDDVEQSVRDAVEAWINAEESTDPSAVDRLVHPAGRVRRGTSAVSAPAPAPALAPEPSALRVEKRVSGEDYHVRAINGVDDVDILRTARENDIPVLLTSVPGTGKTALFDAAFAGIGFEYIGGTADTEVADFVGTYVQHPGGEFVWIDGPLLRAMERGVPLLIDEVALIDSKVLAVVYGAMDGRREVNVTANPERGTVKSAPGFYCVGACNPNAPGARMSEALMSRFLLHIEVTTDYGLARTVLGVPGKAVTAAKNLDEKRINGLIQWAPQMRELLGFKAVHATFGLDMALSNLVAQAPESDRHEVAGTLSKTFGKEIKVLRT